MDQCLTSISFPNLTIPLKDFHLGKTLGNKASAHFLRPDLQVFNVILNLGVCPSITNVELQTISTGTGMHEFLL